ncbi:hypothetical protein Dsin_000179 [Dipteronia sinensis]|uniref:WAT1-related protein n=1 Tax=Dipteronia sinensis TaxID=43782 RepID=A0AAE0DH19_9ROSI|nr:hypothetical protein Dsin_000179 [Dipteronia sinensis]
MDKKKPYLAVILIQAIYAGMFLLSKTAFNGGMNNFVFIFYRQAAATVFLALISLFFEWKNAPPLTFVTFCKIFMLSLCGITFSLDLYGVALIYTSATLAAATTNTLPVITFFLAVLLRGEMQLLGIRLVPSTHTHTKGYIGPTCGQVKQPTYHATIKTLVHTLATSILA